MRFLPVHFHCMSFSERIYEWRVSEETLPGIALGDVRVAGVADAHNLRLEIVHDADAGAPALFTFDDAHPTRLVVDGELDADVAGGDAHLLNIKVRSKYCWNVIKKAI